MQIHGALVTRLAPPSQPSELLRRPPDQVQESLAGVGERGADFPRRAGARPETAVAVEQAEQIHLRYGDLQRFFASAEDRYSRQALAAYAETQQVGAREAFQSLLGVDTYA